MTKQQYLDLVKSINYYSEQYYKNHTSIISDEEFDRLFKKLQKIEKEHPEWVIDISPTQKVGEDSVKGFKKKHHNIPMLSMDNSYTFEELYNFENRIKKEVGTDFIYCVEPKIDGLSISITYVDGQLVEAVTRGDGEYGDDVTQNVMLINSLPKTIDYKETINVRGEIFIKFSTFNKINQIREKSGETVFANPRNLASGTLKSLDLELVKQRELSIFIYTIYGNNLSDSHFKRVQFAKGLGFPTNSLIKRCNTINEAIEQINFIEKEKPNLDYPIDGAVLKVDSITLQEKIGRTAKDYKWQIAYKYKAETANTKVVDIEFSQGRMGTITPVAILEPVFISGTTVSRASLHNFDEIERLEIAINDTVKIHKSGEIIPQILEVVERPNNRIEVTPPTHCPTCNSKLIKYGDVAIRCPNLNCPNKIFRNIVHFVQAIEIDNLGPQIIEKFIKNGLISKIDDIFSLKKESIENLEGMGAKSAQKILEQIENSKNIEPYKILFALGIDNIGIKNAQIITKNINNIKDLIKISKDELIKISDIGPTIAESIKSFFSNSENIEFLDILEQNGYNLSTNNISNNQIETIFTNKKVVLTGNLEFLKRDEAKKLLHKIGADVVSSVSKKTDYIIAGDDAGSKLEKGKKLNIKIIDKDKFKEILQNHNLL